jgi:hypothetical protein
MARLGGINSNADVPVSTSPPSLIAEWNRADLSQLVSGGAVDFNDAGGAPALSVVNVAERGNVLRYLPVGSAGVGTQIFMFSAASGLVMPSGDERRDLNVEIELYDATFGSSASIGVFFCGDADTPLHGFGHCPLGPLNNSRECVLNNGTVQVSGVNLTAIERFVTMRIRGRKPAGAAPEVASYVSGWGTTIGNDEPPRRSGTSSAARGGTPAFGDGSSLGATWNSISATRIGVIIRFGTPPTQIDILNFRLFWAS